MQSNLNCEGHFQKFAKLIQFNIGSGALNETGITLLSKLIHINLNQDYLIQLHFQLFFYGGGG